MELIVKVLVLILHSLAWYMSLFNIFLLLPLLLQLLYIILFFKNRQGTFAVRDYSLHSLKLRASSHHLWHGSTDACITEFLLSTARFLFQQVFLLSVGTIPSFLSL